MARPTLYSTQMVQRIIEQLKSGKSEEQICEQDDMPCQSTLNNWKNVHPEFLELSVRARRLCADFFNQRREEKSQWLVDIAKNALATGTAIPKGVVDAIKASMQEDARSAALRDDSRYGDRKHVALAGEKNGAPIRVHRELPDLTPEQVLEIARMKDD